MPACKLIEDQELGEIKLTKYKRAKYIRIRVNPNAKVAVSLPYYTKYDDALKFVDEKRKWILSEIQKLKEKKLSTFGSRLSALEEFRTKFRELELIPCEVSKATYRLSPTKIKIYYPQTESPQSEAMQNIIAEAINSTLRREAHNYLPRRIKELADKHGLKFGKLSIRNTRTRWGSCTADNNINLCIHLLKLDDELIDYVILHELAHTVHKNHSREFWDFLSGLLGADAKTIDKKLKDFRPDIDLG